MEAYAAIVSKRDTRSYTDAAIADDVLHRILQTGRMAGSAKDAQPVRLVVVREPAQKTALAACGNFTPHVPACAVAVAVVLNPEEGAGTDHALFRGPFDAGRAAQNMMVTAWAEGIASCPASMHDQACARRVLGLAEDQLVANVIAFGYPVDSGERERGQPRAAFDEIVRWERI